MVRFRRRLALIVENHRDEPVIALPTANCESPPTRAFDCQMVNDPAASHRRFLHMRWLAFAIYLAVGVALWRSWPWFRGTFHEAGYVGGMILTALIWPLALVMVAGIMVFFLVGWLLEKLFRLFRHKQ
jgi:hypothetical protein